MSSAAVETAGDVEQADDAAEEEADLPPLSSGAGPQSKQLKHLCAYMDRMKDAHPGSRILFFFQSCYSNHCHGKTHNFAGHGERLMQMCLEAAAAQGMRAVAAVLHKELRELAAKLGLSPNEHKAVAVLLEKFVELCQAAGVVAQLQADWMRNTAAGVAANKPGGSQRLEWQRLAVHLYT